MAPIRSEKTRPRKSPISKLVEKISPSDKSPEYPSSTLVVEDFQSSPLLLSRIPDDIPTDPRLSKIEESINNDTEIDCDSPPIRNNFIRVNRIEEDDEDTVEFPPQEFLDSAQRINSQEEVNNFEELLTMETTLLTMETTSSTGDDVVCGVTNSSDPLSTDGSDNSSDPLLTDGNDDILLACGDALDLSLNSSSSNSESRYRAPKITIIDDIKPVYIAMERRDKTSFIYDVSKWGIKTRENYLLSDCATWYDAVMIDEFNIKMNMTKDCMPKFWNFNNKNTGEANNSSIRLEGREITDFYTFTNNSWLSPHTPKEAYIEIDRIDQEKTKVIVTVDKIGHLRLMQCHGGGKKVIVKINKNVRQVFKRKIVRLYGIHEIFRKVTAGSKVFAERTLAWTREFKANPSVAEDKILLYNYLFTRYHSQESELIKIPFEIVNGSFPNTLSHPKGTV